jgi:hypothetical protein
MSMGAWLRSEPLSAYQARGAHGEPAFRSAGQLRRAVQARLGADTADFLAIPKISEQGDRIDWYAPLAGDVVPPGSQTDDERADAERQARDMQARLREAATTVAATAVSRDERLFADLLSAAAEFPDNGHVYIVNGRPVVTFWGFTHIGLHETRWHVLPQATTPTAATAAAATPTAEPPPVAAPVPPPPRPRWIFPRGLMGCLPLLLLGLLLAGLLWGLRGCAPGVVEPFIAKVEPYLPWTPPPPTPTPVSPSPDVPPEAGVPTPPPGVAVVPEEAPDATSPAPVTPESTPDTAPEPPPVPPVKPPSPRPPPPPPPPPPEPATPPEPRPLVIPDAAGRQGSVDFMEGRWRSKTGLVETRSGQPVVVDYSFDRNGNGHTTIHQKNGTVCEGPARARMEGPRLVIDELEDPRCSDGSRFNRSHVECTMGAGGQAMCNGRHSNGRTYRVDIQR